MFSCKISANTFSYRTSPVAALKQIVASTKKRRKKKIIKIPYVKQQNKVNTYIFSLIRNFKIGLLVSSKLLIKDNNHTKAFIKFSSIKYEGVEK